MEINKAIGDMLEMRRGEKCAVGEKIGFQFCPPTVLMS